MALPIMMSCAPLTPTRWPRWLRNRAGLSSAQGQSGRSWSQPARALRSLGVERDLADSFTLAVDPQDPFAGGEAYVVEVERDGLGDPCAGVERDERECLVAR